MTLYEIGQEINYLQALKKSGARLSEEQVIYNQGRLEFLLEAYEE